MSAREFKMPWGKYKGQALEEIYIEDGAYLDWLLEARRHDRTDEIVQKIYECEKEMRNVRICK
jgi:uncharacterized protein (DUF3820 family)